MRQPTVGVCAAEGCVLSVPPERDRYCSRRCYSREWQRRNPKRVTHQPRECGLCGAQFTPTRSDKVYCGKSCLNKAKYRRSPDRYREKAAAYRNANPDKYRSYMKVYGAENRERLRDYRRAYGELNGDALRQSSRQWAATNPERRRAQHANRRARKKAGNVKPIPSALLVSKFAYWGGRCWMCGMEATQIDHVKPLSKGGLHVLANLRPACATCNRRKSDRWEGVAKLHQFNFATQS